MDRRVIGRVGARRRRGERGAVLVEAAVILPFLFAMIFGIMEIGSVLKSYSGASNGVRAGGRMASVAGNDVDADRAILERMATESAGVTEEIEYIVIWHATSTGEMPPAALPSCPAAVAQHAVGRPSGSGAVRRATSITGLPPPEVPSTWPVGGQRQPAAFYFGCTDSAQATTKVDCFWKAKDRKTTVTPRDQTPPAGQSATPDYVGIYIRAKHGYVTGIMGRRSRSPMPA